MPAAPGIPGDNPCSRDAITIWLGLAFVSVSKRISSQQASGYQNFKERSMMRMIAYMRRIAQGGLAHPLRRRFINSPYFCTIFEF